MNSQEIDNFWKIKLGVAVDTLAPHSLSFSSAGNYVDKLGDRHLIFWEDLTTGARVILSAPKNLSALRTKKLEILDCNSIRECEYFRKLTLVFNDIDYLFPTELPNFEALPTPNGYALITLSPQSQLEEFYSDCSEDDRDTLDLNFEDGEVALAYTRNGKIAAITRYLPIKGLNIADITIVVRQSERGNKLSTPLVSQAIAKIIADNHIPKYRVDEDLMASRRIAEKLGMVARFQILAWELTATV